MAILACVVAAAVVLLVVGNVVEFRGSPQVEDGTVAFGRPVGSVATSSWRRLRLTRPSGTTVLYVSTAVLYLAVGAYLILGRASIVGDAESRVAQAWYVVGSRDPHLAAIGFVWNPLPSFAAIPVVLFRGIWPALTQEAFAGAIVSSLCMAGAVVQFRLALRDMQTTTSIARVLTACFALNPMTVYYGSNGMSEAMYLLFLVGAARYLLGWSVTGGLRLLVLVAINLGLGYLTRYETVAAALSVALVVFFVGTRARDRSRPVRERRLAAGSDVVVVLFPVVIAFVAWAVVSWVITGQPFQQFTSSYGNASIIRATAGAVGSNGSGLPKIALALLQTMSYAPLIVLVGIVVLVVGIRRRDRRFWALAPLAGPLAFSTLAYVDGQTFGFLRYYIPVLPLYLLAGALLLTPLPSMRPASPAWLARGRFAGVLAALLIGVPGLVGSTLAMASPTLGPGEQQYLAWVVGPATTTVEVQARAFLPSARSIAGQIDKLGLPDGSIALDTFNCGSLVVMNSERPHQFIITSDRDFQKVVADPVAFNVPYVLVPQDGEGIEAIGVAHPGIYDGGQIADLQTQVVAQYKTAGCSTYRLIRVTSDKAN